MRPLLVASLVFTACTGLIDQPTPGQGGGGEDPLPPGMRGPLFTCDPSAPAVADPALPRRAVVQYQNTVRDLVTFALGQNAPAALAQLEPTLAQLRPDLPATPSSDGFGSFRRLAQDVQPGFIEQTYAVALAAGTILTAPSNLTRLAPCAGPSKPCIDAFISRFGERALGTPLQPEDVAFYEQVYGDTSTIDPLAFADVVGAMLVAPQFLYRVEHNEALSPYELAARLSFHFWDSSPDDALWAAAKSGELSTAAGYRGQVARLAADPRARAVLGQFWAEWFRLDDVPRLDALAADPAFMAFAGADRPSPQLTEDVRGELADLVEHYAFTTAGTFDDLLVTDCVFPRTEGLAKLYGVATWDGVSQPPVAAAHPGFFTRAALLANGQYRTRPIKRGVFLRKELLCDGIPPPAANADDIATMRLAQAPANQTSREETEYVTSSSAECKSCHDTHINPLGFTLEAYDGLARARTEERIFDRVTGAVLATKPVDTTSTPRVANIGDVAFSRGPADLVPLVQQSGKAHACFARHYARFTLRRAEDVRGDGCLLEALERAAHQGSLIDALTAVALQPAFQHHTF